MDTTIKTIREKVGSGKVLCALSGGVDSSVAAVLLKSERLYDLFEINIIRQSAYIVMRFDHGADKDLGQYFAALTNMRSVGCMGDERTYDYAVALRAVMTSDFMTAESAQLPWEVLGKARFRSHRDKSFPVRENLPRRSSLPLPQIHG